MKVEERGHTVTLKDTKGNIKAFLDLVTSEYNSYKESNIILDITQDSKVTLNDILGFLSLSNKHRQT